MKTETLNIKPLDIPQTAPAPIWLKLLLFATISGGMALSVAGLILLSSQN